MALFFKKTKELENLIDEYLDNVIHGGLLFKQGIKYYIEDMTDDFEKRMKDLDELESHADKIRRKIINNLYIHTLIPEARGDVLGIIESTDKVLNVTAETLKQFYVEIPDILPDLHKLYLDLTDASIAALESLVAAIRSYFRDLTSVRDHINKVLFYEKEADKIGDKIKWKIFRKDIHLSQKIHMRYFALHIQNISDNAEDVTDRLSIATIKRTE